MISYSLHISSKKHALTTTRKVAGASKHNLRQFESEEYCEENIFVLIGGDNILDDVKECYHQEFDDCLARYNEGKRSDRQIDDYIKYVSESGKNNVAVEMIIQLGDEEFWKDKSLATKQRMVPIFEHQIEHLKELVPDFKIVSAVVHLDEKSPHCHIVGVPIGRGYKRGMEKLEEMSFMWLRFSGKISMSFCLLERIPIFLLTLLCVGTLIQRMIIK